MNIIRKNLHLLSLVMLLGLCVHSAWTMNTSIGRYQTTGMSLSMHQSHNVAKTQIANVVFPAVGLALLAGAAAAGLAVAFVVGVVDGVAAGVAAHGQSIVMLQHEQYNRMDFSKFDQ